MLLLLLCRVFGHFDPQAISVPVCDSIDTNMFTFEWSQSIYDDSYLLEAALDSTFAEFALLDSNLTENQFPLITPLPDSEYYWRVKAGNENGWGPYSDVYSFTVDAYVGIDEGVNGGLPGEFLLYQNYPNPFNMTTQISFYIDKRSLVSIGIYDITGALVNPLAKAVFDSGKHSIVWNGADKTGGAE